MTEHLGQAGRADGTGAGRSPWADPFFWLAVALGLFLRIQLLVEHPYSRARGDEALHYVLGVLVANFGTGHLGHWAPGYDALLGAIFAIAGPDPVHAHIVHIALSMGTVAVVFRMAWGLAGRRAARIACVMAAVYPTLVMFSHYFFSENLYLLLLSAAVYLFHRNPQGPSRAEWVSSGVLFGLSALTRSLGVWFFPCWAVWEFFRGRRQIAACVLKTFAVAMLMVVPWTIRNAVKYDGFLLVDGTLGRTAYLAYSLTEIPIGDPSPELPDPGAERVREPCPAVYVTDWDDLPPVPELAKLLPQRFIRRLLPNSSSAGRLRKAKDRATLDLIARQECELAAAGQFVAQNPGAAFWNTVRRAYSYWGPNSFFLRSVYRDDYPGPYLGQERYEPYKRIFAVWFILLMLAGLLAFGQRDAPRVVEWTGLFTLFCTAIHAVSVAQTRYRLPLIPFIIVLASAWLARPHLPEGRGRRIVIALVGAGFVALAVHYYYTELP